MPTIHVLGGGTFSRVAPHLCLAARGSGKTARRLALELARVSADAGYRVALHLTSIADPASSLVTNDDVRALLDQLLADPDTKMIVMNASLVDFDGAVLATSGEAVVNPARLRTEDGPHTLRLTPAEKVIRGVRRTRKGVFLVGFKQTTGATADEQYLAALGLLKSASCNLVLANDSATRRNVIVTPEQARYHETTDRDVALAALAEMAWLRHKNGTFTRSTVVAGAPVPWSSLLVPASLRAVVDHCIARGAYKPFHGATVGHFAVKLDETTFLTSKRKTDFNHLAREGMVLVETRGDDAVVAHGARPSVGGQSQRIVFREHPGKDCIVHFHCPLRPGARVPVASQYPFECGSHQCGRNTSQHLRACTPEGDILAVMLDRHGPNVVFSRDVDPRRVIAFIEASFDLEGRTDALGRPDARAAVTFEAREAGDA